MSLVITPNSSLESLVEKSYGSILSQLSGLQGNSILKNIYLNSVNFVNNPDETQDAGQEANKNIPNITLTAKTGAETPGGSIGWGVREVSLLIEVSDNASRQGSDGLTLDNLFENAIVPLFIENDGNGNNFPALLSLQITQGPVNGTFRCYGFRDGQRVQEQDLKKEGDVVTRSAMTILICTELNS